MYFFPATGPFCSRPSPLRTAVFFILYHGHVCSFQSCGERGGLSMGAQLKGHPRCSHWIIVHCTVSQVKMNTDSSRLNKISSCKWRQHRRDPCEVSHRHHLQWKCSFWALGKLQVCMWRLCRCSFQRHSQEEDHTGSASYQPARKNLPCDARDHTPSFPGGSLCLWAVRSIITITRYELWLCFFFPHLCRSLPVF